MSDLAKPIDKAADAELEVQRLHSLDSQLSGPAYLKAAAAVPGATEAQADRIAEFLKGPEAYMLQPSFGRILKAIRQWRKSGPILRLGGYLDAACDTTLARIDASRPSLFLAAARVAVEQYGSEFGTAENPGKHEQKLAAALAARDQALTMIETSWDAGDVDMVGHDHATRQVCLVFKITGGEVHLQPNLGKALVSWALSQRSAKVAKAA